MMAPANPKQDAPKMASHSHMPSGMRKLSDSPAQNVKLISMTVFMCASPCSGVASFAAWFGGVPAPS